MSWDAAFGYCARIGGHLAVITDATEFNVTKQMLIDYRAGGSTAIHLWVDGTDQVVNGRWMCESINAPCPYLGWHNGQPNAGVEHCRIIDWAWSGLADYSCASERLSLCEFECSCAAASTS